MSHAFSLTPSAPVDLHLDTRVEVAFVGDDPVMADLYRLKLEVDGYSVTLFTTAQESKAEDLGDPDIVYLDTGFLSVPVLAAHRRLRAAPTTAHVPIVLLSNRLARKELAQRLQFGVHDVVISNDMVHTESFWDEFAAARRRTDERILM